MYIIDEKQRLKYFTKPEIYLIAKTGVNKEGLNNYLNKYYPTIHTSLLPSPPEESIEFAARGCYSSLNKYRQNPNFIENLTKKGHEPIWRFVDFHFMVRGISRLCADQLINHRFLNKLQFSTRYNKKFCFVIPPNTQDISSVLATYRREFDCYTNQLDIYNKKLGSLSKAQESARYFLPMGMEAPINIKANGQCWRDIFRIRLKKEVSKETYNLILLIYNFFKKEMPVLTTSIPPEERS